MPVLDRYVTRLFLRRFVVLLFGLVALMVILDFLANADEVIADGADSIAALARYVGLRLPDILLRAIPFAVLLGGLLTMAGLTRHSELTALRAVGVSQFRIMIALAPAALLVAVPQFWIGDRLLPPAAAALQRWGVGDVESAFARDEQGMIWLRQDPDIVRVGRVDLDGPSLSDVTIFRRDDEGRILERITAGRAVRDGRDWTLLDVTVSQIGTGRSAHLQRTRWEGGPDAALLQSLASHPRQMSFARVAQLATSPGTGSGPTYLYAVWMHRKLAEPLITLLIVFLAVPLVQGLRQRAGVAPIVAVGIVIGFLFFTLDGLVLALGEAGLLPPVLAAWGPVVAFAAIAGTLALRHEWR